MRVIPTDLLDEACDVLKRLDRSDFVSETARMRVIYSDIRKAQDAGLTRRTIHKHLVARGGLILKYKGFTQALYRIQKSLYEAEGIKNGEKKSESASRSNPEPLGNKKRGVLRGKVQPPKFVHDPQASNADELLKIDEDDADV